MLALVYTLCDPQTGEIRYVGKTCRGTSARLKEHVSPSRLKERSYKNVWLKSLGVAPAIEIVEEVPADQIDDAERFWISQFRALGFRLTNGTDGGDGATGLVMSQEARNKLAKALQGNRNCAGKKNALGSTHSQESRQRRSQALQGLSKQPFSDAHRLALSRSRGGRSVIHVASGQVFNSLAEAARAFSVKPEMVGRVIRGTAKHTGGHVFKFVEVA